MKKLKKAQHAFETMKINLSDTTPFPKTCGGFFGALWGAKIVKSEQNLKNIRNYGKNNLKNKFVENLHMYFKQEK